LKKVDFILIGAMKCGTTSLASLLASHPDICFSHPKEPDFFIQSDWRDRQEDYHSLFSNTQTKLWGEGSTSYTKFPKRTPHDIAKRIYLYNPDVKLIYLIRNPLDRIISHYRDIYTRGHEKLPFEQAVFTKAHYINLSRYYMQLLPYLEVFSKEQILILTLKELNEKLEIVKQKLGVFLNVPSEKFMDNPEHANKSDFKHDHRVDKFLGSPKLIPFKKIIPPKIRSSFAKELMSIASKPVIEKPVVTEQILEYVTRSTQSDIECIESLIERKLLL